MSTFFEDTLKVLQIDDENSITIRALTLGVQKKIQKKVQANKSMTMAEIAGMTAKEVIVSWDGPKFADMPVTPENIDKLPISVAGMVASAIEDINAPLVPMLSNE